MTFSHNPYQNFIVMIRSQEKVFMAYIISLHLIKTCFLPFNELGVPHALSDDSIKSVFSLESTTIPGTVIQQTSHRVFKKLKTWKDEEPREKASAHQP